MPDYVPISEFTDLDDEQSSESIHNYPADKSEYKLNIFPSTMDFASTKIGEESSPIPLVLINTGYSPLLIESVQVVGCFELVGEYPTSLEPDQAISILAKFVPNAVGALTGGIFIDTGNAAGTEFIKLTGIGSSAYVADLTTDIIRATNNGLGTADAIQSTTDHIVPTATAAVLIAVDILLNNTGAATIYFGDQGPFDIKEVDGSALEAGDLVAGTMVLGYITGSNFRLLTDNTLAAALAMLVELTDAAEASADAAAEDAAAIETQLNNIITYTEVLDLSNVPAESTINVTVAVANALLGDVFAGASFNTDTQGLYMTGFVSAVGEVSINIINPTEDDIDLGSATLKIKLLR